MKTKEELNALKNEVEELNKKLAELTEEELSVITGGYDSPSLDSSVKVEVGKWYKMADENAAQLPATLHHTTHHWYCAEDLGGNKFRFEHYICTLSPGGNDVSRLGDLTTFGVGFVEYYAPFPLPR